MKRIFAASIATVAMTAHAHAAIILASGHLLGGEALNQVACYVNNVGSKSVTLSSVAIIDSTGASVTLENSCSPTLGKGGLCFIYSTDVNPNYLYSCAVKANALSTLRGSIELRNKGAGGSTTVLNSEALR